MGKTTIEWTATYLDDGSVVPGYTFNPWIGCARVSRGCSRCYAERLANRFWSNTWGPPATTRRRLQSDRYWQKPVSWDARAQREDIRYKVFCGSMCDVFEDHESVHETRMLRLWPLVERTTHLDWLLLTKRPENVLDFVPALWTHGGWPEHVWLGVSVEDQERADERIPKLLEVPAEIRFLSCEPLLGPIDLSKLYGPCGYYCSEDAGHVDHQREPADWVIAGGESGPNARPMHPDWVRGLRDQCAKAGVAMFVKQMGSVYARDYGLNNSKGEDPHEWPRDLQIREFPNR